MLPDSAWEIEKTVVNGRTPLNREIEKLFVLPDSAWEIEKTVVNGRTRTGDLSDVKRVV